MYEIIPWLLFFTSIVVSVFRKEPAFFFLFTFAFLVTTFIYFVYATYFLDLRVSDFYSVLSFHLGFLLFLSMAITVKLTLKYEILEGAFNDPYIFYPLVIVSLIVATSQIVGAYFLGYSWIQYIFAAVILIYITSFVTIKYLNTLFVAEIMTIITVLAVVVAYYVIIVTSGENMSVALISSKLTNHPNLSISGVSLLLLVFAKYKIVNKRVWERLAATYIALFTLGFTSYHPEIKEFTGPVLKNVFDLTLVTGEGGVTAVSIAAMAKNRLSAFV